MNPSISDRFRVRIWDKKLKMMISSAEDVKKAAEYEDEDSQSIHSKDEWYTHMSWMALSALPQFLELNEDRLIGLQCTGRRDKNGTLIFEGDVVAIEGYQTYDLEKEALVPTIWEVEFSDDAYYDSGVYRFVGFSLLNLIDGDNDGTAKYMFNERIEILGNIYENPELLNLSSE